MKIEEAIDIYLKSKTTLTDLVGRRIYYIIAPDGAKYPYVVFSKISDPHIFDIPLRRPRFQFSSWAMNKYKAREIADVIVDILQRYKGLLGGSIKARISIINDLDIFDSVSGKTISKRFHVPVDAKILYKYTE